MGKNLEKGEGLSKQGPVDQIRQVLEQAYDDYAEELYRLALVILASPAAAEDAVHQVFIKMIKMGKESLQVHNWGGYLRAAVRHECYRMIERVQRQDKDVERLASCGVLEPLDAQAASAEEQEALEQAIRSLPDEQREVLCMKVYENKTFKEIGNLTNTSTNTAASRYRYAMDKLKETLLPSNQGK